MTHFLYCYKDDGHDGQELRYSLRSLETYWQDEIDITIVGPLPSWMTGVTQVEPRTDSVSVHNVLTGVLRGARNLLERGIEEAVYMDDDYVLMDPADKVFPIYVSRWDTFYLKRNRLWENDFQWFLNAMDVTQRIVGKFPGSLCFEAHRPMPFEPERAVKLLSNFEDISGEKSPFWRSTYGNLALPREAAVLARDVRAVPSFKPGSAWASTDAGKSFDGAVAKKLQQWFPTPSRWERDV